MSIVRLLNEVTNHAGGHQKIWQERPINLLQVLPNSPARAGQESSPRSVVGAFIRQCLSHGLGLQMKIY